MIRIYINNDFEANITSLMSNVQWANVKFFPEPTGEHYGWLLTTLVFFFCFFLGGGGVGGGGGLVFQHQGSTFLQWAYLSNDLPRPRRSVLSECF